jgi:hypothetical protein
MSSKSSITMSVNIGVGVIIIGLLLAIVIKVYEKVPVEIQEKPDNPEVLFFLRATGGGVDPKPALHWDKDENHPYDFEVSIDRSSPSEAIMFADIPEHFAYAVGDISSLSVLFSADENHLIHGFKESKGYQVAHTDTRHGFNLIAHQLSQARHAFYKKNPNCSLTFIDNVGVPHTMIAMLVDIHKDIVPSNDDIDRNDVFKYRFRLIYPAHHVQSFPENGHYNMTITFDSFWNTLGLVTAAVGAGTACSAVGAFTFGLGGIACAGAVGGYIASAGDVISKGDDELFTF